MKNSILVYYPHFQVNAYASDFYVADYTQQNKNERGVEILTSKPTDIDSLELINPSKISIATAVFDTFSFRDRQGMTKTQCEGICFPDSAQDTKTWMLFLELKYGLFTNARKNMEQAKKQLFATMNYFKESGTIAQKQLCYLVASLPKQNNTSFENFVMTQEELIRLRREENVIFRGVNHLIIQDANHITL